MTSVGIIEDNQIFRSSLEQFIAQDNSLYLLFSCNSIEQWLSHFEKNPEIPSLLFLDLGLPGISGLKAISFIRNSYPDTKIVVITSDNSQDTIWEAITNGANGFLLKPFAVREIKQQIDVIKCGGAAISPEAAQKLILQLNARSAAPRTEDQGLLTPRESEVLEQLVKGMSYKEVSNMLNISFDTVNGHIKRIYVKMGVNSKSELIAKVLMNKA
jgi:DNA-binding NarL/FixJ family response regulator